MKRISLGVGRVTAARGAWLGSLLLTACLAAPATAQGTGACFNSGGAPVYFYNLCDTTTSDIPYQYKAAYGTYFAPVGANSWLVLAMNSDVNIYNADSQPVGGAMAVWSGHMPWDWTSGIGRASGHDALKALIRNIVTLGSADNAAVGGFPYGLAMLGGYGWDFLQLQAVGQTKPGFLGHGFKPPAVVSPVGYTGGAMLTASNGSVWVAAQALDQASIGTTEGAIADPSIRLYQLSGKNPFGATVDVTTLTPANIVGQLVPAGHAGDDPRWNDTAFPLAMDTRIAVMHDPVSRKTLLLARPWLSTSVLLVDVSTPSSPQVLSLDRIADSNWAVDDDHGILWVGSSTSTVVNGYRLDLSRLPNGSPWVLAYPNVNYNPAGGTVQAYNTLVSYAGGLLVASSISITGYLSVPASGQPYLITGPVPNFTSPSTRACLSTVATEATVDTEAYTVGSNVFVARALKVDADVVLISPNCLSTTPTPRLTVTATTPIVGGSIPTMATCAGTVTAPSAAVGFPGDTFTVADGSSGSVASGTLTITSEANGQAPPGNYTSWTEAGANAWTPTPVAWASPSSQSPGVYDIVMTLKDASNNSYPLNQTITLCDKPMAGITITAVNGVACGGVSNPCTYLSNDTITFSAGPGVSQGTPTAWAWFIDGSLFTQTPSLVPTFDYKVPTSGGPYTVSAAAIYGFTGVVDAASCGTMAPSVANGGNWASCATSGAITPQSFYVGAVTASQTNSTFPTFNTSLPITVSAPYKVASGYSATFIWNGSVSTVGAANPASLSALTQTQSGTVTGTISSPTAGLNQSVTLTAMATDGTNTVSFTPAVAFDVTACTAPGQPSNPSPSNGSTLSPGSVTVSWSAPTGTGPFSYNVGYGIVNYCRHITTTSCQITANLPGTTYPWQVTATNDCGTTSSPVWSFTTSGVVPTPTPTPTPTPPPGGRLTITPSPNPASAGQSVTFVFSPQLSQSGDSLTFNFGDGQQSATISFPSCGIVLGGCSTVAHTFNPAITTTYTVNGSGAASGASVSGSTSVTVQVACALPAAPVASFTYSVNSLTVQFTDASPGGPTSWAWNFGDGGGLFPVGTSSTQSPTYTFRTAGTYTVTLTATNCKGSSQTSQPVTVSSCNQTTVPTASFTWPTGAVAGFPEQQQQPYVGQAVTLTDTSTNGPTSWAWTFGDGSTSTQQNPAHAYAAANTYTVTLAATNCFGPSAIVPNTVTVYADVRHVNADFTWGPDDQPAIGESVTLVAAQGAANGNPDTFTWMFDDGTAPQSGASTTHAYTCAGPHKVTLTASRSNFAAATAAATHTLTVTGQPLCAPQAVMTVDAAKVNGLNGTVWRTNVRIFNPSTQSSKVTVDFVPLNVGSPSGPGESTTLAPNAAWVLDDILGTALTQGYVGAGVTKAALRFTYDNIENTPPVVVSDTYTSPPSGGGTYGALTPGIEVVPTSTPPVLWIAGIRNNGTTTGFRTNYSFVNLRNDAGVQGLKFTLFGPTGTAIATQTTSMNTLEYRQDSLANLFGGAAAAVSPDPLALKVEVPTGSDVQAYVSVMDNLTGDPVLISAVPPPTSPIFLPAVAHTPGLNGTVWRSDLQITNPDSAAPHTWEIKYLPRSGDSQTQISRTITLAAQASTRMDDLLSWVFNGLLSADASTSGMVRIAPADGSSVYPIVQTRSFNQTPNGTFGQNITPVTADMGVAAGQGQRLLLTGMSSQDVARTNLGFVNLSDTSSVIFSAIFYDEGGNVLNPKDGQGNPIPYTTSLNVGGWDQDLLENRFKNTAGFPALGGNLRAISAVIQVTGGGPGTVYATVIDAQTGDPNFILAQPAP